MFATNDGDFVVAIQKNERSCSVLAMKELHEPWINATQYSKTVCLFIVKPITLDFVYRVAYERIVNVVA